MPKAKAKLLNPVGASRAGHEYHEIWAARKSLQLLLPKSNLAGIAMEGFDRTDQDAVSKEAAEIADLTLYYGKGVSFKRADKTVVVQFKYSVSSATKELRASEAKKTIGKFADAFRDHIKTHGIEAVKEKLVFEYITNRPINDGLQEAVRALAEGVDVAGDIKTQATQLSTATKLNGEQLKIFAGKLSFWGGNGNLRYSKQALALLVVNWSATNDANAMARLGQLKDLIREKASAQAGQDNVIYQTDILHVLGVSDRDELLPSIDLPKIGKKVKREQLAEAVTLIPTLQTPLVIHAAGGVGKTVFMESIAEALHGSHEVSFFDCFGGGAYRSPEDARHLPKNGLMQIANSLAFRGLCDPILPGVSDEDALLR